MKRAAKPAGSVLCGFAVSLAQSHAMPLLPALETFRCKNEAGSLLPVFLVQDGLYTVSDEWVEAMTKSTGLLFNEDPGTLNTCFAHDEGLRADFSQFYHIGQLKKYIAGCLRQEVHTLLQDGHILIRIPASAEEFFRIERS